MSFGKEQMSGSSALRNQGDYTRESATTTSKSDDGYPNFRGAFNSEPQRQWEVEVVRRVVKLLDMPEDWDSYGAPKIKKDAGMFALEILQKVMRPRTPMPQIVPTAAGGIQIEWHEKGIDLEIDILGPYECELWYRDQRSQQAPSSTPFSNDFSLLREPIGQLTAR
jgi:hypothetical protein